MENVGPDVCFLLNCCIIFIKQIYIMYMKCNLKIENLPVWIWNVTARCVQDVFKNKAVCKFHVCCFVWSSS